MPGQIVNPDGTVQVSPPTQSAFAQPPGPPGPPVQPPPMVHSGGTDPGFLSALFEAIKSIAGAAAPKSITQAKSRNDAAENEALGNSFNADQK